MIAHQSLQKSLEIGPFVLIPMQHLFASMMNLNATFLVWKKILNMVRYLEEVGSFCFA